MIFSLSFTALLKYWQQLTLDGEPCSEKTWLPWHRSNGHFGS